MSEWISVNDSLPEIGEDVLVVREDGCYSIEHTVIAGFPSDDSMCVDIEWECDWEEDSGYVTHWMPIPEPPEAER